MKRSLIVLALVLLPIMAAPLAFGGGPPPAAATSAGSATAALPSTLHNPASDPAGYVSDLQTFEKVGWPLLILVVAFGLLEIAAWVGQNIAWLAWFGKGRISIVISGSITLITSMVAAIAAGASWSAVLLGAAVPAMALFAHPAGTDPEKR